MPARYMTDFEIDQARKVFQNSLNYDAIILDSHVGLGNRPFTAVESGSPGEHRIYIGSAFFGCFIGVAWSGTGSSAKKVKGVTVKAWRGSQLKGEATTDKKGIYEIPDLPSGQYDLQFSAEDSKAVWASPVQVFGGDVYRIDAVVGKFAVPNGFHHFNRRDWPLLMHELTHVWQGQHGIEVFLLSAFTCQIPAAMTALPFIGGLFPSTAQVYAPGSPNKPWDDYNVEQQASIVQKWWESGSSPSSVWFKFIRDHIRKGKT